MTPKRKKVQDYIITMIMKVENITKIPSINKKLYEDLFASMNDKQFDEFMKDLRDNNTNLAIVAPHDFDEIDMTAANAEKVANELGFSFYHNITYEGDGKDIPTYTPEKKAMVLEVPVKKASQLLFKKFSVSKDNKSRDQLTGQVTNSSASAKITGAEMKILSPLGLKYSLIELAKVRGGDLGSSATFERALRTNGRVNLAETETGSTGVVSKQTLSAYFAAAQIKTNLRS